MTTAQVFLTIIEILAVSLIVVGLFNEAKIAKWERRMFKRICLRIIRAYDRRQEKKAAVQQKKSGPKLVYTGYSAPVEQRHYVA